jgi:hypothetical protein
VDKEERYQAKRGGSACFVSRFLLIITSWNTFMSLGDPINLAIFAEFVGNFFLPKCVIPKKGE